MNRPFGRTTRPTGRREARVLDLTPDPSTLEPIETASRDELEALQLERLQETLRHAYEHVPHYRRSFDAAGVHPDDCRTWASLMARSIRAAGGRPGDVVHVAYGYGLFTGGLGAHYGAEALGCTVVPVSGGMTERQGLLIHDFRPDVILVTPSYMLAIVDELEQRLDMHAVDIYGLSEVMGPGVSVECVETKDGLHIWEDHFYPEIIDPLTEEVLPEGERGELVFTSLTKEAMPVIRYRTRDLTRLLPGTARPGMRRMGKGTGRTDDMIILRGVNLFPTQIEEMLLATEWCGGHFILELTREGRMDELTIFAEARP